MIKVAVIDGNAISRNLLTSLLAKGGFDVVGDANASSAGLASVVKLKPQIVCIDIGTTDEEGWQRLETIRSGLPKALVFMVSGQFEPATIELAARRGVHGFIVKPFKEITVLTHIRNAIIKLVQQYRSGGENESEI